MGARWHRAGGECVEARRQEQVAAERLHQRPALPAELRSGDRGGDREHRGRVAEGVPLRGRRSPT
eukprot:5364587-Prymnesium_polylepis.1